MFLLDPVTFIAFVLCPLVALYFLFIRPQRMKQPKEPTTENKGTKLAGGVARMDFLLLGCDADETIRLLFAKENGKTLLEIAAQDGKWEVVKLLVGKIAAATHQDENDLLVMLACFLRADSRLHLAAFHGQLESCQLLLLENGAQINQQICGCTPLHVACAVGHLEIAKFLVETGGADVGIADFNGDTALMAAVRCQKIDVVRYLLSKGASIDRCNFYGGFY